jgi:hypothetical protein
MDDLDILQFATVNDAAVTEYGYNDWRFAGQYRLPTKRYRVEAMVRIVPVPRVGSCVSSVTAQVWWEHGYLNATPPAARDVVATDWRHSINRDKAGP